MWGRMTRQMLFALSLGLALGLWSTVPASGQQYPPCPSGCCGWTVDCGSPSQWRCCYPKDGEANCAPGENCGNYCLQGGCNAAD